MFRPFGFLALEDFKMISALSVPDEGYSRNALCALNLISTFLLHTINNVYERMFILLHEKKGGDKEGPF